VSLQFSLDEACTTMESVAQAAIGAGKSRVIFVKRRCAIKCTHPPPQKTFIIKVCTRAGAGLKSAGLGFTLWAQAFAGLAWGRARGLACGLSPKTRPARAWAFWLCSKARARTVGSGLGQLRP
jgi:hypothetical protein